MAGGVSPLVEVEEVLQGRRRIYTHSGSTTHDNGSYMGLLIYTKLCVNFPLLFCCDMRRNMLEAKGERGGSK